MTRIRKKHYEARVMKALHHILWHVHPKMRVEWVSTDWLKGGYPSMLIFKAKHNALPVEVTFVFRLVNDQWSPSVAALVHESRIAQMLDASALLQLCTVAAIHASNNVLNQ